MYVLYVQYIQTCYTFLWWTLIEYHIQGKNICIRFIILLLYIFSPIICRKHPEATNSSNINPITHYATHFCIVKTCIHY